MSPPLLLYLAKFIPEATRRNRKDVEDIVRTGEGIVERVGNSAFSAYLTPHPVTTVELTKRWTMFQDSQGINNNPSPKQTNSNDLMT